MSIQKTLEERGNRYGKFSDHAVKAQELQDAMRKDGWEKLNAVQKQALTVIADKIARILSGDPNYDDNWHDIQGYAKLAEDHIKELSAKESENKSFRVGDKVLIDGASRAYRITIINNESRTVSAISGLTVVSGIEINRLAHAKGDK